jgi:hypothetical protein
MYHVLSVPVTFPWKPWSLHACCFLMETLGVHARQVLYHLSHINTCGLDVRKHIF